MPLVTRDYVLHIAIQILLWGFVYTAWSLMGKFGLVSLGHGAFLGIGAYVSPLLWNYAGVTPWLGIPIGVALAVLLALIIGYPCFRLRVVGHYFALVTLALSQVALLTIVAARDITGGSLGMTPKAVGHSWYALQFPEKPYFYAIALVAWVFGILVWHAVDIGKGRAALEAIAEDEGAAAAIGIDVMREKLRITRGERRAHRLRRRAALAIFHVCESRHPVGHRRLACRSSSRRSPAACIRPSDRPSAGLFTIALPEILRISIGTNFVGAANTIYGALLVIFIIFMPRGIVGLIESRLNPAPPRTPERRTPKRAEPEASPD